MTRLSSRERVLRDVSEKDWTAQVVRLAQATGWLVHHSRPAMNQRGAWATWLAGHAGLPDLILLRPPRLIFAELKRQHGGVTSDAQTRWLDTLRQIKDIEVYVWIPGEFNVVWKALV